MKILSDLYFLYLPDLQRIVKYHQKYFTIYLVDSK